MPTRNEIAQTLSKIEARDLKTLRKLNQYFSADSLKKTICFTGPAGVGKSTFISRLATHQSQRLKKIAWLACDPSSLKTGGGLLGDRVRLSGEYIPENLFVRSIATRSTQAYSKAVRDMAIYLENFFDEVWIETAGSGQTQQEVAWLGGITVLILQPETGDDVQWMKAGVQEWADFYVIHKSDLSGADAMRDAIVRNGISADRIILVSSKENRGFDEYFLKLEKIQSLMIWRQRLRYIHDEHFRDIFLEKALTVAAKKLPAALKKNRKKPYSIYQ